MHLVMDQISAAERYKLMSGTIVPRPIAWVSTLSDEGIGNIAPYSFFNMLGASPPLVVLGAMRQSDGQLKDTARNIVATGEFVINLVSEPLLEPMNLTCADAPPDVDEALLAGLAMAPSLQIAPQRIAAAPVSFECRLHEHIDAPPDSVVLLGVVLAIHIDDRFIDPASLRPDPVAMQLVGRVHGPGAYTRVGSDRVLDRPVYADLPGAQLPASID